MRTLKSLLLRLRFAAVFSVAIVSLWGGWLGWETNYAVSPLTIRALGGSAYYFDVPAGWNSVLGPRSDAESHQARSYLTLWEDDRSLGPSHAVHADIRESGEGRYSHWASGVYFSASDNSDPRSNGRQYAAVYTLYLPAWAAWIGGLVALSMLVVLRMRWRRARGARRVAPRWVVETVQAVLIGTITVAVFLGAAELIWRAKRPFLLNEWPASFDPKIGFVFQPGARVRWTNQLDFWSESTANSLGFLDREPNPEIASPGVCNVTVLGDSFVEAAQVPIDQKFHVVFEKLAQHQRPDLRILTQAFGYSGTGQLNQLPFYLAHARPTRPDVVVLVFVNNDMANNSGVLESVRNGWSPLHPPRQFALRDAYTGSMELQSIDPEWSAHVFQTGQDPVSIGRWSEFHTKLRSKSYFYEWMWAHLSVRRPALVARIAKSPNMIDIYTERLKRISEIPLHDWGLSDWRYPDDMDMDAMFNVASDLPAVFEEAWDYTAFAIDTIEAEAERDGARVVAILSTTFSDGAAQQGTPRETGYRVAADRLSALLDARGIPYVDQQAYIDAIDVPKSNVRFPHDGHWSPEGHRYAAQALMQLFERNPDLCAGR